MWTGNNNTLNRNRALSTVAASIMVLGAAASSLQAETLADALAGAYRNSGLIDQNRALLRAADEDVATAAAALKPIINYTASLSQDVGNSGSELATGFSSRDVNVTQADLGLVASLLLFDGGASRLDIEAAKETVLATRQSLVSAEQLVLFSAVEAYMTVFALRDAVRLQENSLRLLQEERRAAQDRFDVGEVTRTDVAQAEASVATARSDLANAQGSLQEAIEAYVNIVGRVPGELSPPPSLPPFPSSVEAAKEIAARNHPDILRSQRAVAASELNVLRAEASVNPTISAFTSLGVTDELDNSNYSNVARFGVELSGPIYQGGAISSSIRRAIAFRDNELGILFETTKGVVQDVGTAYASFESTQASLAASQERIRAEEIAFTGVREEAALGARTTLDVLDAEQDLLDAQTARVSDEANLYIAAYAILQATGRLTAQDLGLNVQLYDPVQYYNLAKDAPTNSSVQGQQLDRVLRALQKN